MVSCDRCDGSGSQFSREDGTMLRYVWLRTGVCTGYVENPPSEMIARNLNEISRALGTHPSAEVCIHSKNPCISTCGVEHHPSGWVVVPPERRLEWFQHVYTFDPQRRDVICKCQDIDGYRTGDCHMHRHLPRKQEPEGATDEHV